MSAPSSPPAVVSTFLETLPLEAMIGGPMQAAIRAQALAAKTTVEFITDTGLEEIADPKDPTSKTKILRARIVSFTFTRSIEDLAKPGTFTDSETSLTVPLLAVLPIPTLRIRDMNITFESKINSTVMTDANTKVDLSASASLGGKYYNVKLNGSYSYQKVQREETDRSATLKITVNAVQDTIPEGLSRVITILQDAIIAKTK